MTTEKLTRTTTYAGPRAACEAVRFFYDNYSGKAIRRTNDDGTVTVTFTLRG